MEDDAIRTMSLECQNYFKDDDDPDGAAVILRHILEEDPILWLGSSLQCLAAESIKLVTLHILSQLPYYQANHNEVSAGLKLGNEPGPLVVSSPLTLLYCKSNVGAFDVAKDIKEMYGNISLCDFEMDFQSEPDASEDLVLLLYLNDRTFSDTESIVQQTVEFALKAKIKVVLVHEIDKDKGGCSFTSIWDQAPPELLNPPYKLYDEIAVPLYSLDVYRQASLRLLVKKWLVLTQDWNEY